jgi:multimeric flavodoxin WrbA
MEEQAPAPARSGPRRVTVFVGSAHRGGATWRAACRLREDLESFGDVRCEIVVLSDHDIGVCRGCRLCFDRGEERCPLRDDRDALIGRIMTSDGVVFATPNYSFQVSAIMKIFLDRLGFLFHRPRFHGRAFTAIVVQGISGGGKILKYLRFAAGGLGFTAVKGSCIRTLEPMSPQAVDRMEKKLADQARRFRARLLRPAYPVPSLMGLMAFRMTRTGYKIALGEGTPDYTYYRHHGLFEADYYYPTRLGPVKKAAGALFDWTAAMVFRRWSARAGAGRAELAARGWETL